MVNLEETAPDFKLPDTQRNMKSLADYRGNKTVLAFFPGAFTAVCTKEMCTFRDSMHKFNKLDAKVVGISVDSPFSLAEFAKQNRLEFDLLSDSNKEVSTLYGALHDDFIGVPGLKASKRAVFILDRDGKVRYRWVSDDPGKEPDYSEIEMELENI